MKQQDSLMGWSVVWWLFKLFGLPITIPWLLYHFFDIMQRRRQKAALKGKVVMITGASSGLGEALAHVFYNCGCRLILVSRRKEELERVKNDLLSRHNTIPTHPPIILTLDLTEINSLQPAVERVLTIHGKIDILINNAGISYRGEVTTTKVDVDIKVMLINYFAQIALAKAVLPSMIKQNTGHVVCISSVQGKVAIPYRSAYAASKHALQAWCDSARAELAKQNIKFAIINPGYIKTSLSINAVTGSGDTYGVMDKSTEEGFSPRYVAEQVLKAVLKEEKDVTVASFLPKCAIVLRVICPSLYFWIMQKRAEKIVNDKKSA